ncbi:MAG: hypothetical protein ACTHU0_21730 [Kofleriaceae bacterium]
MLKVLGIDPGAKECTASLLIVSPTGAATRERSFTFAAECPHVARAIPSDINLVAVEMPEGFAYATYRVPHLLKATAAAARAEMLAYLQGIRCIQKPAEWWRGILCRKPNASDAHVRAVLKALVSGAGGSVHAHDGSGIALAAAWEFLQISPGRRPQPSAEAEREIFGILASEAQKKSQKRAATIAKRQAQAVCVGGAFGSSTRCLQHAGADIGADGVCAGAKVAQRARRARTR